MAGRVPGVLVRLGEVHQRPEERGQQVLGVAAPGVVDPPGDKARRVLEHEHVLLHHLFHRKRDVVEILPLDHQEHRHAHVVATDLVEDGHGGSLAAFVLEVPVKKQATERRVRSHERGGVCDRAGAHDLMAEHGQLGDYPPQGLTGKTFTFRAGHDEDRKGGTVEHASAGHRPAPLGTRDVVAMANWRSH